MAQAAQHQSAALLTTQAQTTILAAMQAQAIGLLTAQAPQDAVAAARQHEHDVILTDQAIQDAQAQATQSQAVQGLGAQAVQISVTEVAQHQHADALTAQAAQEDVGYVGTGIDNAALVTAQGAQGSQALASAVAVPPSLARGYTRITPKTAAVNACGIATQQAAQDSRADAVRDTNYLTALCDLDEDLAWAA